MCCCCCCLFRRSACRQLSAVVRKNTTLCLRRPFSTAAKTLSALVFVIGLWVLAVALTASRGKGIPFPPANRLEYTLPPCLPVGKCANIVYAPNTNPALNAIMADLAAYNTPPLSFSVEPRNGTLDAAVWGMATADDVFAWVLDARNTTNAAIILDTEFEWGGDAANGWQPRFVAANTSLDLITRYQIWYNASLELSEDAETRREQEKEGGDGGRAEVGARAIRLQMSFDRAVIAYGMSLTPFAGGPRSLAELAISFKAFPSVPTGVSPDAVAGAAGSIFLYCAMMFGGFILLLVALVSEKEAKLRAGMQMMGLPRGIFWLSWAVTEGALATVAAVLVVGTGMGIGFAFFRLTSVSVTFLLFLLFGLALIPAAFFVSTLLSSTKAAVFVGIVIFILGLLMTSILFTAQLVYLLYKDTTPAFIAVAFSLLLPVYNFGKVYQDIAPRTYSTFDYATNSYRDGPGFAWADLWREPAAYRYDDAYDVTPPGVNLLLLVVNIAVYALLTWYFDAIMPSASGMREGLCFCCAPSYCRSSCGCAAAAYTVSSSEGGTGTYTAAWAAAHPDVVAEAEAAADAVGHASEWVPYATMEGLPDAPPAAPPVVISDLHVRYGGTPWLFKVLCCCCTLCRCRRNKAPFEAVRGLSLTLPVGQVTALAGHNGAGKTSAVKAMLSLVAPSRGAITAFGRSVVHDPAGVLALTGVCPQHDILFPELSAVAHLKLFARIRGVPESRIPAMVAEKLEAVKLVNVADKASSTYSGGMKRRLSVAIATIGNPKLIVLDEPTTGLDVVNRAHVWDLIERMKPGRAILLTSHSMVEVDTLAQKVAIMTAGRLATVGDSLHIKSTYGSGYAVNLIAAAPDDADAVADGVEAVAPLAVRSSIRARNVKHVFPTADAVAQIPAVFAWVESVPHLVTDWGMSQTSLEEAFVNLGKREEEAKDAHERQLE